MIDGQLAMNKFVNFIASEPDIAKVVTPAKVILCNFVHESIGPIYD